MKILLEAVLLFFSFTLSLFLGRREDVVALFFIISPKKSRRVPPSLTSLPTAPQLDR